MMEKQRFSPEDLKWLLIYLSNNPAIPFPNLSKQERDRLIKDILNQYEEMKTSNDKIFVDNQKGGNLPPEGKNVSLFISR